MESTINLIPLTYDNEKMTVLGRDLHAALEIKSHYRDWFPRMCEYGFEEGVDYIKYPLEKERPETTVPNPNPKTNHQLTLDMAKEIAMIQRTPLGRKIRKYLIEVEKQYKSNLQDKQLLYYDVQATVAKAIIAAGQVANVLHSAFNVNQDIARAHALTLSEKEYDIDLSSVKKLLPATTEHIEDLTPTLIANQLTESTGNKHSARQVNNLLAKMAFQYKDHKEWKLTEMGKQYGSMFPYENNGHSGYQLRWKPIVVQVIMQHID